MGAEVAGVHVLRRRTHESRGTLDKNIFIVERGRRNLETD